MNYEERASWKRAAFRVLLAVCVVVAFASLLVVLVQGCVKEPTMRSTPDCQGAKVSAQRYDGHVYLVFRWDSTNGAGVVHDPNCPCKRNDDASLQVFGPPYRAMEKEQ